MSRLASRFEAIGVLLGESVTRPTWAYHHFRGILEYRGFGDPGRHLSLAPKDVREFDSRSMAIPIHVFDQSLAEARAWISDLGNDSTGVIPPNFDASNFLAELVYALTRIERPAVVVEIGVGRGATTRAILSALATNAFGELHSIEFPSLRWNYAASVGSLVSERLRSRWTLHFGPSAQILPRVARRVEKIDLFVHDGGHTYASQYRDLRVATENMEDGGLLVVDDVNNSAFIDVANYVQAAPVLLAQPPKRDPVGLARVPARLGASSAEQALRKHRDDGSVVVPKS